MPDVQAGPVNIKAVAKMVPYMSVKCYAMRIRGMMRVRSNARGDSPG